MDLLERRKVALGPAYHLFYDAPAHLVRGQGIWLWDAQGRKYLDCYNVWLLSHGQVVGICP